MVDKRVAIDFETYLIDEEEGTLPRPVCLSYYDGEEAGLLIGSRVPEFLRSIPITTEIIAHNVQFEFGVILKHYPELTDWVLERLAAGTLWCTLISEQIIDMRRTVEHNKYSLAALVLKYLDKDISAGKSGGDAWRLRYSELDGLPISKWPKEAVEYSLSDSIYAYKIREYQDTSHLDSVISAIQLGLMSDRGFKVRKEYVAEKIEELKNQMGPIREELISLGMAHYNKKGVFARKTKVFMEYLEVNEPVLVYTTTDRVSTTKKSLTSYETPASDLWYQYAHLDKMLGTYFKTLGKARDVVRTDYNAVVDTCRTSSRGSSLLPALNMQNAPKSGGVRESLEAREGFMLCSIDYGSLELLCAAQQLFNIYGRSSMMDVINEGDTPVDLHSVLGAYLMSMESGREVTYKEFILNKKEEEYKNYRQLAKPINLGYPGGIGPKTMSATALDSYGVTLSVAYARELKRRFFQLYPELDLFLNSCSSKLRTGNYVTYKDGKKVPEYYYIVQGIKRAGCTYNAACNGFLMQTPGAIGTKRMLRRVLERTIKDDSIFPLAFIHDELLLEIREGEDLEKNVEEISYLMIDSMKEVLPNIRISVEADVGKVWSKDGMGWSKIYWR